VEHHESTRHGESICVDLERQIRFLVEQYGLKEIAVNEGGVQIAITGDGAALTTSSRKAGQTCLGIKMVDRRCLDPMTQLPCFAVMEETEMINVEVPAYNNVQLPVGQSLFPKRHCLRSRNEAFGDGALSRLLHFL
jgi:hypothetical protein